MRVWRIYRIKFLYKIKVLSLSLSLSPKNKGALSLPALSLPALSLPALSLSLSLSPKS